MTNEWIDLLPSADLRAKIQETGHVFEENKLLQILYTYAPTFDTRLSLLERFAETASAAENTTLSPTGVAEWRNYHEERSAVYLRSS